MSPPSSRPRLDVLVVAAHRDLRTAARCLQNLMAYLPDRGRVQLATDRPGAGRAMVDSSGLSGVTVIPDAQLLSTRERRLPGWYRQQIIKLRAGYVSSGDVFGVMSGDTLLARQLPVTDLIAPTGRPYLYVNRYRYPSRHLEFERRRVRAVAELLGLTPRTSLELGDFICDLFCFERATLTAMIARLQRRFGHDWTTVLDGRGAALADQDSFGEYTLYAVAALESGSARPPVRIRCESHVLQLHSRHAFERARFDAPIVHIVDKALSLDEVTARAASNGSNLQPVWRSSSDGPDFESAGNHP